MRPVQDLGEPIDDSFEEDDEPPFWVTNDGLIVIAWASAKNLSTSGRGWQWRGHLIFLKQLLNLCPSPSYLHNNPFAWAVIEGEQHILANDAARVRKQFNGRYATNHKAVSGVPRIVPNTICDISVRVRPLWLHEWRQIIDVVSPKPIPKLLLALLPLRLSVKLIVPSD
jgi:hypothetical protein